MPVVSLVFRFFAGESILAWGVRLARRADDDLGKINNRAVCSVCTMT